MVASKHSMTRAISMSTSTKRDLRNEGGMNVNPHLHKHNTSFSAPIRRKHGTKEHTDTWYLLALKWIGRNALQEKVKFNLHTGNDF
jgi:hypothetical protein